MKQKRFLYLENPELFKQIHPTKNDGIDLYKLTIGSGKKIWWVCEKGHDYIASVFNMYKIIDIENLE